MLNRKAVRAMRYQDSAIHDCLSMVPELICEPRLTVLTKVLLFPFIVVLSVLAVLVLAIPFDLCGVLRPLFIKGGDGDA